MKLSTLLFFLYLCNKKTASAENDILEFERDLLVGLGERYNLEEPIFNYDSFQFDFEYVTSDFMKDAMVDFNLYDGEACRRNATDITENDYLLARLRPDLKEAGDGSDTRTFKLSLTIDTETIISSPIYKDFGSYADIRFCVRFFNSNTEDRQSAYWAEVSFQETPVYLTINLKDGFNVEANVESPEVVIAQAYEDSAVIAYLCDFDANQLEYGGDVKEQGESVRVCVKPTAEVMARGGYIKYIDEFAFYLGDKSQVAIRSGTQGVPANALTEVACTPGSELCAFETLLAADFFVEPDTVVGSGTAFLQLGRGNFTAEERRRLQTGNKFLDELYSSGKSPQELLDARPSSFSFNITTNPGEEWFPEFDASPSHCTLFASLAAVFISTLLL